MTDLRERRIVVVAHSALPDVVEWAHESGYGVYQLPVSAAAFDPAGDPEVGRAAHREVLSFVASQLRVYLDNGYEVVGAVFRGGDDRERVWADDFLAAADARAVRIPRTWTIPADGRFEP